MIQEEQIQINGTKLNYAVAGDGPPMIFLHNGGGFWHSWEHQMKHFYSRYSVYGIDWPGFGESEPADGLLTLEVLYETLREFIHVKHLSEVVLVGNCIGASAACKYAQEHPEQVSGLVLFNICPGDLIFPRFFRSFIPGLNDHPRLKKISGTLLEWMFLRTPVKRKFPKILFGNKFDSQSELVLRYNEKFKTDRQTKSRINLLFSVHTYTYKTYLDRPLKIPHMLLWGAENKVTAYSRHGEHHRNLLQPTRFELVTEAGHLCMYERPDIVNQLINQYLLQCTDPNCNITI
jgi:pimeloyl-ACP methyl ester carboxylesterase